MFQQIIKHTSVEHADYDSLLLAQTYIHELATKINRQKEESEEMEQRLREIEAIVDGLDDVSKPFHKCLPSWYGSAWKKNTEMEYFTKFTSATELQCIESHIYLLDANMYIDMRVTQRPQRLNLIKLFPITSAFSALVMNVQHSNWFKTISCVSSFSRRKTTTFFFSWWRQVDRSIDMMLLPYWVWTEINSGACFWCLTK